MIGIIAAAMTALISVVVWYLKYQTKRQAEREEKHDEQQAKREEKHDKIQEEDRKFHRDLITNHLTSLQKIGAENSKLNSQSMILQKDMIKHMEEHNDYCVKASKKTIESFSAICDKLNGKIPTKDNKANGRK